MMVCLHYGYLSVVLLLQLSNIYALSLLTPEEEYFSGVHITGLLTDNGQLIFPKQVTNMIKRNASSDIQTSIFRTLAQHYLPEPALIRVENYTGTPVKVHVRIDFNKTSVQMRGFEPTCITFSTLIRQMLLFNVKFRKGYTLGPDVHVQSVSPIKKHIHKYKREEEGLVRVRDIAVTLTTNNAARLAYGLPKGNAVLHAVLMEEFQFTAASVFTGVLKMKESELLNSSVTHVMSIEDGLLVTVLMTFYEESLLRVGVDADCFLNATYYTFFQLLGQKHSLFEYTFHISRVASPRLISAKTSHKEFPVSAKRNVLVHVRPQPSISHVKIDEKEICEKLASYFMEDVRHSKALVGCHKQKVFGKPQTVEIRLEFSALDLLQQGIDVQCSTFLKLLFLEDRNSVDRDMDIVEVYFMDRKCDIMKQYTPYTGELLFYGDQGIRQDELANFTKIYVNLEDFFSFISDASFFDAIIKSVTREETFVTMQQSGKYQKHVSVTVNEAVLYDAGIDPSCGTFIAAINHYLVKNEKEMKFTYNRLTWE